MFAAEQAVRLDEKRQQDDNRGGNVAGATADERINQAGSDALDYADEQARD
jgi:hypothetical protein